MFVASLQTTDKLERDRLILFLNALIKNKVRVHVAPFSTVVFLRSLQWPSQPNLFSSCKDSLNKNPEASKKLSFASIAAFF